MRILGYIVVIGLILGAVGYFRGWFVVSTARASGRSEVTLGVDEHKISADSKAATSGLGKLSAKAAEALKSFGRKVTPDETELEGTLTSVDVAARDLTVNVGSESIDLHVPSAVPITLDGETVGFDRLRPTTHVSFSFEQTGEGSVLSRVAILP